MGAAALPLRRPEHRPGRFDQPGMGIGGDQLHPRQAAGSQITEEPEPPLPGLRGAQLQAEDLAVAVVVDAGGDHGGDLDDPAVFTHFEHERVGGDKPIRPSIERPGAERFDRRIQVFTHL